MTERCTLYGVSRKTGYQWGDRYLPPAPRASQNDRGGPLPRPARRLTMWWQRSLDARHRPPAWGAKARVALLRTRPPHRPRPARSTVCDLRSRHGLAPQTRQRRAIGHPGRPARHTDVPNAVWSAAGKGQVKTGDGHSCSPLTIADGHRRFLLGCQALSSTRVAEATPVFTRLCQECGVPQRIRTDTGGPWPPVLWAGAPDVPPGGPPGERPRVHRARNTPAERPSCPHASRPEGGHPSPSRPPSTGAAAHV
jgi:putative transposase